MQNFPPRKRPAIAAYLRLRFCGMRLRRCDSGARSTSSVVNEVDKRCRYIDAHGAADRAEAFLDDPRLHLADFFTFAPAAPAPYFSRCCTCKAAPRRTSKPPPPWHPSHSSSTGWTGTWPAGATSTRRWAASSIRCRTSSPSASRPPCWRMPRDSTAAGTPWPSSTLCAAAPSRNQRPGASTHCAHHGREDDRGRAREAGFHAHLVKPVTAERLTQLIAKFAASNRGAST
jgi:hypothetical protein